MSTVYQEILQWKESDYSPPVKEFLSSLGLWEDGFDELYSYINNDEKANRIVVYISLLYDAGSKRIIINSDRNKTKIEVAKELFGHEESIISIIDNKDEEINKAINYYVVNTQDVEFNAVMSGYEVFINSMQEARRNYGEDDLMKILDGKSIAMTPSERISVKINQAKLYLEGVEVLEKTKELHKEVKQKTNILSEYVKAETGMEFAGTGVENRIRRVRENLKNKKNE